MEVPPSSPSLLLSLLLLISFSSSSEGANALVMIKDLLNDPDGVLNSWDDDSEDPCSWAMVTCSPEFLVTALLLQNNNITGPIPAEIGKLRKLKTLDLSSNYFHGEIPTFVGHLESLQYLILNNNTLPGSFPSASANLSQLVYLDLSYNNLSGPIPRYLARTFNIVGDPLICAAKPGRIVAGPYRRPCPISPAETESHKFAGAPFLRQRHRRIHRPHRSIGRGAAGNGGAHWQQ